MIADCLDEVHIPKGEGEEEEPELEVNDNKTGQIYIWGKEFILQKNYKPWHFSIKMSER